MTTTQQEAVPVPRTSTRGRELALGLVFGALGAAVFALARSIEVPERSTQVSPRIWPEALGIGLIGLSVLQMASALLRPPPADDTEPSTRVGIARVVGFVGAVLAFGLLWYFVDFLVSGLVLVAGLTWIAGGRGVKDLLVFPAVVTVVLYGLFVLLLKVPL